MAHIPGFGERRNQLTELVKRFRKGDKGAQVQLQTLLADPEYKKVFAATYKGTPRGRALQMHRVKKERTNYKTTGGPVQGGAPGSGKR